MHKMHLIWNVCLGGTVVALALLAGCDSTITYDNSGGAGGSSSSSSSSGSSSSSSGSSSSGGGEGGFGGMSSSSGVGGTGGAVILPECNSGKDVVLAVDKIFWGDTNADGTPNPTSGWKSFGYDIDGRVSTKTSTDLCQPSAGGAKAAVYPDGVDGIDNSFGKNVLPLFLGLASDFSTAANESIANGELTYLLSLENVGGEACSTSSAWFLGGNLGKPPLFDGSDVWPIDASSLIDPGKPSSAKCSFPNTSFQMGLVSAGPPSQFDLVVSLAGLRMVLPVRQARLRMNMAPDGQSATGGHIGGIIRAEDLVVEVAKVAAAFDSSFCDPNSPTLISILNQLRQASDILLDGSQDPSKDCDGISIGLGFTMKAVQLGGIAPPVSPPPNPCSP